MRGVVALELEPGAVGAKIGHHPLEIAEGVAEDDVAVAQIGPFPFMLQLALEAIEHREEAEVHRPHIQARKLRFELGDRTHPLLDAHVR